MKNKLGNAKECKTLIKHGLIRVNNIIVKNYKYLVKINDIIIYKEIQLKTQPFNYFMMNKPAGYICANKDIKEKCVIDLINNKDCYCLGRLDKDTTGLLIITDDPTLSKKLLLPQNHVQKKYLVSTKYELTDDLIEYFNRGVIIDKKIKCLPADLKIINKYHCYVTIIEGRYHQIKKMFLSCGNQVNTLKRIEFGQIKLDKSLGIGQYRSLTNEEIILLIEQA